MNETAIERLDRLAGSRTSGDPVGLTSVCSAHPLVVRASLRRGARTGGPVLIEATCNQVNQEGGYTGLSPADFMRRVAATAAEEGLATEQLLLGGDHLGPNPWKNLTAAEAMDRAETMVAAYAEAGFTKLHLDCSMGCRGETATLSDQAVAERAARLATAAERAAETAGHPSPRYIIGTEVPPPGGADHTLDQVPPTDPDAAKKTLQVHREVFEAAGLASALNRVRALVVQPGVEFGHANVHPYDQVARHAAEPLACVLDAEPGLVFEAHSTDYQPSEALAALVDDGFAILKVGPGLTFALRKALYGLDRIAATLMPERDAPPLPDVMEAAMRADPRHWQGHYKGEGEALAKQLHESLSDRVRYYWGMPRAEAAVARLLADLAGQPLPAELLTAHLPRLDVDRAAGLAPEDVVVAAVDRVLADYAKACRERAFG